MMFVKIMSFLVMFLKMSFTRNQSERVRNEAVRLMREREDKTTMTQVFVFNVVGCFPCRHVVCCCRYCFLLVTPSYCCLSHFAVDEDTLIQRDADRRIGERLHDETFWRSELQSELERNINETHQLEAMRKNLERALAETEGPMRVNSECIYHREGRKGIDMVNDGVENSLMREVDQIKSCQDQMKRTLEQVQNNHS